MYKNDRRLFERFIVDFSAEIKAGDQKKIDAYCCDISASGTGLFTEEKLIPNTKLEICMVIPNKHASFCSSGRVVWSRQVQENRWRSGFEFDRINLMGLSRVLEVVTAKA